MELNEVKDKKSLSEYIHSNFTVDGTTARILDSVINYADRITDDLERAKFLDEIFSNIGMEPEETAFIACKVYEPFTEDLYPISDLFK